jgi:hypothetical protein
VQNVDRMCRADAGRLLFVACQVLAGVANGAGA